METMTEALRRMSAAGYETQFRADGDRLRDSSGRLHAPEELEVDEVARFEGESNPADESAVFALRARALGIKGTYVVAFGPNMDLSDARIVPRLGATDRRGPLGNPSR